MGRHQNYDAFPGLIHRHLPAVPDLIARASSMTCVSRLPNTRPNRTRPAKTQQKISGRSKKRDMTIVTPCVRRTGSGRTFGAVGAQRPPHGGAAARAGCSTAEPQWQGRLE